MSKMFTAAGDAALEVRKKDKRRPGIRYIPQVALAPAVSTAQSCVIHEHEEFRESDTYRLYRDISAPVLVCGSGHSPGQRGQPLFTSNSFRLSIGRKPQLR